MKYKYQKKGSEEHQHQKMEINHLSPLFFKKSVGDIAIDSVRPSRYLLLNRWTKFNQIWCVSCSHGKGVQRHIFFGPAPWGPGEIFKPNFVCLLTNERYKTYQTGFSFPCLGHAPGVGLGDTVGGWGSKNFFSQIQQDLVFELLT